MDYQKNNSQDLAEFLQQNFEKEAKTSKEVHIVGRNGQPFMIKVPYAVTEEEQQKLV